MRAAFALVLAVSVAAASPAAASALGQSCQARKLAAAGRAVRDVLRCSVASLSPPECYQGAVRRLRKTFRRNENAYACETTGDAATLRERVDTYALTERTSLGPHTECYRARLLAIGDRFFRAARARAVYAVDSDDARLAARIARADEAYFAAFAAAEGLPGCTAWVTAAFQREFVDVWVDDFRRRLFPACGDDTRTATEECDGRESDACPGKCTTSCTCPVCGNGVKEPGEQCDGAADEFCPGACASDCTCPGPVCGDGVVSGTEQCDLGEAEYCAEGATVCAGVSGPLACRCCIPAGTSWLRPPIPITLPCCDTGFDCQVVGPNECFCPAPH
ncbi:MAG TPA: hypothetical protein VFD92_24685 [Candidatus Binatia bacterium]|nr:hypothetical protein [Candidatus Binatia bacterium]